MLEKELVKIGLTEKEAKVYLAVLELGKASVQKISGKAKVNRATTYVILEGLIEKGIIETIEIGKKRFFVAMGPYYLKNFLRKKQELIDKKKEKLVAIMPELKKIHQILPVRAVVRFYEGKDSLNSIRQQFLECKSKKSCAFYSANEMKNFFSKEERRVFSKLRREKGIHYSAIYNLDNTLAPFSERDKYTNRRRVPKEKFYFPCEITIYDDLVSLAILKGYPSGIVIESPSIAETFRSIFKLAWRSAEKYQN